jgi:hypothetical protein
MQTVYANRDSIILQSSTIRDTFFRSGIKPSVGLVFAALSPTLKQLDPKGLPVKCHGLPIKIANRSNSDESLSASHDIGSAITSPKLPLPSVCSGLGATLRGLAFWV